MASNPNQKARAQWLFPLVFAGLVAALWAFPTFWYTQRSSSQVVWYAERETVPGWQYTAIPVAKAAEAALVGDRMVNGEFASEKSEPVRVFSAKRYEEKANEIGLFMHTPDRCWTQAGWKLESATPEVLAVDLHGIRVPVERRIFTSAGHRELVYFAGTVAGEPLPYRLDHHLSVARRYQVAQASADKSGAAARATDTHYWARLWDSFLNRRQLLGPKHFFRISTPLAGDIAAADARLQKFLSEWLEPVEYAREVGEWKLAAASKVNKPD